MSTNDELLQQLGHVSELRREFSVRSLGSLCLCLMGTWEALSSMVTAAQALDRLLIIAISISIISFVGTIVVASSLSEIASIYPTAGGIRAPATQIESSVAKIS